MGLIPSNYLFILLMSLGSATCTSSLKCYKCISLSCPETKLFCDQVKKYVLLQLPELYYFYEPKVPFCPDPVGSAEAWESLKFQSSTPCGQEKDGQATCMLGRFQVTTVVKGVENITSYGTTLGCAKRKLLEYTKAATLRGECSIVTSQSAKKDSLTHFLEIEHCSVVSDMCMRQDYCIDPKSSAVKIFRENYSGGTSVSTLFIILGVFLVLGCMGLVLTLVGFKYN